MISPRPETTITYLEMNHPPHTPAMALPKIARVDHLITIPYWYFVALYRAVGKDYHWTDQLEKPQKEVEAFLDDPRVTMSVLMIKGAPYGFYVLDQREGTSCDLAYFGLTPNGVGHGLGRAFLRHAIDAAWSLDGINCVKVNTCTLDHEAALRLYKSEGFVPVRSVYVPARDI